jgi:MFS family permease
MDEQTNTEETNIVQPQPEYVYGPRKISFFTLVLKTFAGFAGGIAGTLVLLLIFLSTSSILQPVLGQTVAVEAAAGEVSPLFMVVLMGMVFATSIVSSLLATLLLSYTERDRYTKIATMMSQVFIINIVIFAFVLPIYLTTSTTRIELTAFAAFMQIILSATASAMILELIHDHRYALMAVYTTILAILVAMGMNFFIFYATGTATIVLFCALPIIWSSIGFSQAALGMIYFWMYETWGSDFLASTTSFGTDYGIPDTSEEEAEEEAAKHPDVEGGSFLKQ